LLGGAVGWAVGWNWTGEFDGNLVRDFEVGGCIGDDCSLRNDPPEVEPCHFLFIFFIKGSGSGCMTLSLSH
jgi:hypothetical protein